jgi:hypothetical protein
LAELPELTAAYLIGVRLPHLLIAIFQFTRESGGKPARSRG